MRAAADCGGPHEREEGEDRMGGGGGDSKCWPPGFRFHPTDEELVLFYLKRKISRRRFKLKMIGDVDVYKWEPWELPEKSLLRSGDKQWYYFSPRDRKYPNGSRSNRATKHGYWKATGKDRTIMQNSKAVGNKKTLVYYHGRAPKGQRTDWVMHEYSLDEQVLMSVSNVQDSFALYKLFRKSGPGPKNGEQYGAPFREEVWDEDVEDDSFKNQNNIRDIKQAHLITDPDSRELVNEDKGVLPNHNFEETLLQMPNEVDVVPQKPLSAAAYMRPVESQGEFTTDGEFLEMKDLHELDSVVLNTHDMSYNGHVPFTDGLVDLDDYFDAQMFLTEAMGPGHGITQNSYWDGFCDDDDTQSYEYHLTTELWTHEQVMNEIVHVEPKPEVMAPSTSSGMVYANQTDFGQIARGEINNTASPAESWFSSTLSVFLDSIPSDPALASENALISRAIERVSSFRATRIQANPRRHGGYLFISFLVGVGAIFWILSVGALIRIFKGFWGRFVSS